MPSKKAVNNNSNTNNSKKTSKNKKEVIVEDVSDEEESVVEVSEEETGSDEEVDSEAGSEAGSEDDNEEEDKTTEKKEKPKKLTHEEILNDINKVLESENVLESEISELEKTLASKIKLRTTYRKSKNKLIGLLPKAYIDGLNKARKEKKKRTNNSKSGILAEHPVPPVLLKFLNLPDSTLLMRPKVFSLLNNKFKELGLKKGQDTILDKKTAKLFGVEEGHVIKFQECQKFLANIYEKANTKSTEVAL